MPDLARFDLSHRVAIVTGGNGGIGLGMARALAAAGARVVVAARNASKDGLVQLTKALAAAWAPDNIQVNAVLPGWIDTDLTRQGRRQVPGLHERVVARTPAGRWGTPDDVAGIAV